MLLTRGEDRGAAARTPLRRALDERGIRVGYFARLMGVRESQLSHIARGMRHAPAGFWERAALALGTTPQALRPTYCRPSRAVLRDRVGFVPTTTTATAVDAAVAA